MGTFGGMSPYPRRFGGARPVVQTVLESLNADRGTAFNATSTTTVYIENMALARAIAATWGTNERLGNCWIPARMSQDVLARWESILNILPAATDSPSTRRARVGTLFALAGFATNIGYLNGVLSAALGAAFVGIDHIDISNARVIVPDGTWPFGITAPDTPWSSTVVHILVQLQKPSGWAESDFYAAAAKVALVLEPILPVWATFDWYRAGPISTPVAGGPSAGGFYLDDPTNLDNEVFAT